jgi:hypothetical protein
MVILTDVDKQAIFLNPKPWQVRIDVSQHGDFCLRVQSHTHGSIAFSDEAAKYCLGKDKEDEDGYIVSCHCEPSIVSIAREIARMSELTNEYADL